MRRLTSVMVAALLAFGMPAGQAALADDEIPVTVTVVSTEGAPEIKAQFYSPVGKKSDAAKLSVSLTGLDAAKPVFFRVTPLPDAISRADTDASGNLTAKVELPYGLEPGVHQLMIDTTFSSDNIAASYTVGEFFVNDFGVLTNQDGSYPKGTRPVQPLLPNSAEAFETAPKFLGATGTLRISEPQTRISQGLLPNLTAGITINNSMATTVAFETKITLTTIFGNQIGEPYYAKFDGLGPGDSSTLLLKFKQLPPLGWFRVTTELVLPADFTSTVPVQTSQTSTVFVLPAFALASLAVLVAATASLLVFMRRRAVRLATR